MNTPQNSLENIARNKQLLAGLGLEVPGSAGAGKKAKAKKALPHIKKVKKERSGSSDAAANQRKSARVAGLKQRRSYAEDQDDDYEAERKRRRNKRRDDYSESESDSDSEASMTGMTSDEDDEGYGSRKRKRSYMGATLAGDGNGLRRRVVNGRNVQHIDRKRDRPDPKVFGPIRGIEVGHWWPSRMACSADSVHPVCHSLHLPLGLLLTGYQPTVGGIYGTGAVGAYSVAVSGGYEDDIDEGFRFTFTGSGGRDLKGTAKQPKNLRTAPQSSDQTLTGFNLALKTSCDTGKPVRVIRGYKAALGPDEGYRYDGLYTVLKAWQDTGLSGFKVWRFAFKRIDGQKPLNTKRETIPPKFHSQGSLFWLLF